MVRKVNRNSYGKYYKEYYNIDYGSEFNVHHIDMNRDNNDIKNLLLLPKQLHHDFHNLFFQAPIDLQYILFPNFQKTMFDCRGCGAEINVIECYSKILCDMYLWKQYKDTNYRMFKVDGIIIK